MDHRDLLVSNLMRNSICTQRVNNSRHSVAEAVCGGLTANCLGVPRIKDSTYEIIYIILQVNYRIILIINKKTREPMMDTKRHI